MFKYKHLFLFSICITLITSGFAQQIDKRSFVWYFGTKAGLSFHTNPPTPLTDGGMESYEGCASICDTNGNILFYSEGSRVYNKNHVIMQNGGGLLGNIGSAQTATAIPYPGNNNLYYLFTIDANGSVNGLRYSVIDMSLDNGNGAVTSVKNQLLYNDAIEKISAVKHKNDRDFWVIVQQRSSNNYRTYLINPTGIMPAVISTVGSVSSGWYMLKASPQGNKVATNHASIKQVSVFDFDNETGILSNPIVLNLPNSVNEIFGLEFSPNGKVLYSGNYNGTRPLYQWNLEAGTETDIRASRTVLDSGSNYGLGGLQLAPDGKIYIAREGKQYLSVINNPNEVGISCDFQEIGISLAGRNSRYCLPTVIQSSVRDPIIVKEYDADFSFYPNDKDLCYGDTVFFNAIGDSLEDVSFAIDNKILFGDSVFYVFNMPGVFEVIMAARVSGMLAGEPNIVKNQNVTVFGLTEKILPIDTSFCENVTIEISSTSFNSIEWTPNTYIGSSITSNITENIFLKVSDQNGCAFYDSIYVFKHPKPIIDFLTDTVCVGEVNSFSSLSTVDSGYITEYNWILPDNSVLTGVTATHTFLNAGEFTIGHFVESSFGCIDTAFKINVLKVLEEPTVDFVFEKEIQGFSEIISFTNKTKGSPFTSLLWTFDKFGTSEENNPILEINESTKFIVRLEIVDSMGCEGFAEKEIIVSLGSEIHLPNAFSPNGDNKNEVFKPIGIPFPFKYQMEVFNRWGELLFVTNDINVGWDGTYMGNDVTEGIYIYKISLVDYNGKHISKKGNFTLVR